MDQRNQLTLNVVQKTENKIVMRVLKETAEWLKNQKSSQWSELLEGEDKHQISEAINKKQVFFLKKDQEIIGMVALWKEATEWDQQIWKKHPFEKAYYIHRLIIRPSYRGLHLGSQLLNIIKEKAKEEVSEIRLDCLEGNTILFNFYKNNGFEYVGDSRDINGVKFTLFRYKTINKKIC